jgi:hypothetical protein
MDGPAKPAAHVKERQPANWMTYSMIQNDEELNVTRERIVQLLGVLARLRISSRPDS